MNREKALQTHLPDKIGAMTAEGRLLEEASNELVVLNFVNVFLPQSAFTGEPVGDVR